MHHFVLIDDYSLSQIIGEINLAACKCKNINQTPPSNMSMMTLYFDINKTKPKLDEWGNIGRVASCKLINLKLIFKLIDWITVNNTHDYSSSIPTFPVLIDQNL